MLKNRLGKPWKRLYMALRAMLWGAFLASMALFAFSILFPSQDLSYTFSDSKTGGNEIERPRTDAGDTRESGRLRKGETLVLDASVLGDFSHARVSISGKDTSDNQAMENIRITAKRSQQAFFYPKGPSATFPSGTLMKHHEEIFLVGSDGLRHRFDSEKDAALWGYDTSTFLSVSDEELLANSEGDALPSPLHIGIDEALPNGAFIRSDDTYYAWKNDMLYPFVSTGAFLEQFPEKWALIRENTFIKNHAISDEWIGYPSGSLLAWGDGVFIMDGSSPRPVLGADIFLSLGYSWDDVRTVSDEEISLEQKGKFVDISVPQPDGTVFMDTDEHRYFLVQGETLREIHGESMLHMWLGKRHPVLVSSKDSGRNASCTLTKASIFSTSTMACSIPLESFANIRGDTYELSFLTNKEIALDRMDIVFESSLKEQTLVTTLSKLKSRILSRYLPSQ